MKYTEPRLTAQPGHLGGAPGTAAISWNNSVASLPLRIKDNAFDAKSSGSDSALAKGSFTSNPFNL